MSYATVLSVAVLLLPSCDKANERLDMTRYVIIYPGPPIVEFPGQTHEMKIVVRNVSALKLTNLRLTSKSEVCSASISPANVRELNPADRTTFAVQLTRTNPTANARFPLQITLYAGGLPVPAGLDLLVDMGPKLRDGWIDVGQVTILRKEHSRLAYYVLAGAPLLLCLGWLLYRLSRRPRRAGNAPS